MGDVPRKTRTRADKALGKVNGIVREIKQFTGAAPTIVRVNAPDFLALTECNYLRDGKLSGTNLDIKIG